MEKCMTKLYGKEFVLVRLPLSVKYSDVASRLENLKAFVDKVLKSTQESGQDKYLAFFDGEKQVNFKIFGLQSETTDMVSQFIKPKLKSDKKAYTNKRRGKTFC